MRTWALSAGLSWVVGGSALLAPGCEAVPVDPYVVPYDTLSEKQRNRVERILSDVAAVVPLERSQVRSRPEVYDFLLSEMPFTGGVVRELGRGKWDIFRDPEKPDPNVFFVIEPEGMRLRFELIHKEKTRRFYVTKGVFAMGLLLPPLEGSTLIILRAIPRGDVIDTDAVVYVKVESPGYANLAKGARSVVEEKVREKSGYFIKAAKWVAEEAAQRPDWLYRQVNGSKEVDQVVLEEFRRRFLVK